MSGPAADLAGRLAREAEAVCRTYLSNGRRAGRYWLVGDVGNTPGRSLFVRLTGPEAGPGAAGHWTDAATAQHGDLLDLIGLACEHGSLRDTLDEARRFLREPRREPIRRLPHEPVPAGSDAAARRLFAGSRPVVGTLAETYLRGRGLTMRLAPGPLRFHPACYHRGDDGVLTTWPALIAAVTDLSGRITGVQRTWLARDGSAKAPLATPRRAMGGLLGHGVRFGLPVDVLAAGEGIETILALRSALPGLPCVAALSANHLAALLLPESLRHLYIAQDLDSAGQSAAERLAARAGAAGVEVRPLVPIRGDFNDDLVASGVAAVRARLLSQLTQDGGNARQDSSATHRTHPWPGRARLLNRLAHG